MTPKELELQQQIERLETRLSLLRTSCQQDHDLLEHTANVIRPGVKELHRRAVLEAEIAETMSYQRHRLDHFNAASLTLQRRVDYLELPWYKKVALIVRAWFR